MSDPKFVSRKTYDRRVDRVNGKFIRVDEKIATLQDQIILLEEAVKRLLLQSGLPKGFEKI